MGITITNDQNRLTPEDIERMINDAEKFADEDAKLKGKVEARNELESYAYSLKNQLSDKEKLGGKLSDEETAKIEEVINEKIAWLEENADADADEMKAQKKEMEDIVQPMINLIIPLTNLCPTSKTLDPQLREVVGDCHQDDHQVIKSGVSFSKAVSPKLDPLLI